MRSGLMALAGQTIAGFLEFMQGAYGELHEFVQNSEGKVLLQLASGNNVLATMAGGALPIDIWSRLCSNLLVNYLQVYQLSSGATYKRGRALGHGEAHAMLKLRSDNEDISNGKQHRKVNQIALDIAKLLDVQFRVDSLGVGEYAFAVHHWIEMLNLSFPLLMAQVGPQIIQPVLEKQLAPSFKQALGVDHETSMTVADLLQHKKLLLKQVNDQKRQQLTTNDPQAFEAIVLAELKKSFTANVGVMPSMAGQAHQVHGKLDGKPLQFSQQVYMANQLDIGHLRLSDQDRPKTKFIQDQRSHTVPWTLAREAIHRFQHQPVTALLAFLHEALQGLARDMKNEEGRQSTASALDTVQHLQKNAYSIQNFSMALSNAVRLYFIAYQVADSTTYINPGEMDRAQGHGEAVNMKILRTNDFLLKDRHQVFHDPERIIRAALGMFDASITGSFKADNVVHAYHNAIHKLQIAFPAVMAAFGKEIVARFMQLEVAQGKKLADIVPH